MSERVDIVCPNCGKRLKTVTISSASGARNGSMPCPNCHAKIGYDINSNGARAYIKR